MAERFQAVLEIRVPDVVVNTGELRYQSDKTIWTSGEIEVFKTRLKKLLL